MVFFASLKPFSCYSGQVEKRMKGESVEVVYPNGTIYSVTASGDKVWVNLDGTTIVHYADRDEKKIFFPNKQVETHTKECKVRNISISNVEEFVSLH